MQAEQLQHFFRVADHFLQFIVSVFRLHDLDQFHFIKLMDANHAARPHARRPRFTAETRRVRAVINGQLLLRQNFFAMDVCHRRFRRGYQIEFAQILGIVTFGHAVILVLEFRKLSDAHEAMLSDHMRRRHFGVVMPGGVEIE